MTLDDDVAAALAQRRAERGTGLRHEINALLRAGLDAVEKAGADPAQAYELPTFDAGRALVTDPRAVTDLLDDEDDATRGRKPTTGS